LGGVNLIDEAYQIAERRGGYVRLLRLSGLRSEEGGEAGIQGQQSVDPGVDGFGSGGVDFVELESGVEGNVGFA
jgi:hypothetical protein